MTYIYDSAILLGMDFELDGFTVRYRGKIYRWDEWYQKDLEEWGYQTAEFNKEKLREIALTGGEWCELVDGTANDEGRISREDG